MNWRFPNMGGYPKSSKMSHWNILKHFETDGDLGIPRDLRNQQWKLVAVMVIIVVRIHPWNLGESHAWSFLLLAVPPIASPAMSRWL